MADLGSIVALKADIDAKVTTNGANENTGARVNTALNNMVDTLYTLSATPVALRTGSTIAFDAPAIYNSPTTPSSGTVTLDLSGAVPGEVVAYFNHAAVPTWPAGVTAVGVWNNSALNVVRFVYRDASNISAVINSGATAPWTLITKTALEQRQSTTTLAVDAVLKVPMVANAKYNARFYVRGSQAAASGLKYGFNGPAGTVAVRSTGRHTSFGTAPAGYVSNTYETTGKAFTNGSAARHWIELHVQVETGATAGDLQFTWAQNSSEATNASILDGSYVEYNRYA